MVNIAMAFRQPRSWQKSIGLLAIGMIVITASVLADSIWIMNHRLNKAVVKANTAWCQDRVRQMDDRELLEVKVQAWRQDVHQKAQTEQDRLRTELDRLQTQNHRLSTALRQGHVHHLRLGREITRPHAQVGRFNKHETKKDANEVDDGESTIPPQSLFTPELTAEHDTDQAEASQANNEPAVHDHESIIKADADEKFSDMKSNVDDHDSDYDLIA